MPEEFETEAVNIREVISIVEEDLEIRISEKKAVIQVDEIPLVKGNKIFLTQLFSNLIGNAIKFSTRAAVVNITGQRKGSSVFIHVADNGIGIEPTAIAKIFEAFHRLNASSEYEGSGIGLTICKKIADIHKGNINVESTIGEGTIFTVELPAFEL